jgi:hypothetical protein
MSVLVLHLRHKVHPNEHQELDLPRNHRKAPRHRHHPSIKKTKNSTNIQSSILMIKSETHSIHEPKEEYGKNCDVENK